MTLRSKFLVYCGLTCMGGSEKRECACEHPRDCEMRGHPDFETYHRQAGVRLLRVAAAEARRESAESLFLRLNEGDRSVVAFCGAPHVQDIVFNEETQAFEEWSDGTWQDDRGRMSFYAINVYVVSINGVATNAMRVFAMGFRTCAKVIVYKDRGTVYSNLFEISRHATGEQWRISQRERVTTEQRSACGAPDPDDENGWFDGSAALIGLDEAVLESINAGIVSKLSLGE